MPVDYRRGSRFRFAAHVCWWLSAVLAASSVAQGPAWLLALAAFWVGLGFIFDDVSRARHGGLTPITVFAFAAAITGLANAVGLFAVNTQFRDQYLSYAAEAFLPFASRISFAGMLLTVLGFRLASQHSGIRALFNVFPRARGNLPDRALLVGGPLLAIAAIVLHIRLRSGSIGSILSTVYLLPHIVAFLLARAGTERRVRRALLLALVIATLESVRALFLAYLRTDIVSPFIAVALGALLGARSLSPLRSKVFIPLYVFAAAFVLYFGAFAQARTTSIGMERLQAVTSAEEDSYSAQTHTFSARLTNFNQLSQVGRIASESGFLHGKTLEYLGFVFVPRFLWPDKPIIQKGAWFAWRIGQARILPDGRYSNSVNMTVPGELYLNFGWPGVFGGCLLFGAFVAMLWSRTSFWERRPNLIGAAFGYYLFWTSLTMGADLQIMVTLLATYLIFVAAGVALRVAPRRTVRRRLPGIGPMTQLPVRTVSSGPRVDA